MSSKLLPVTSREYKVVLKPSAFTGGEERLLHHAIHFWSELAKAVIPAGAQVTGNLGSVMKRRSICFYDTPGRVLFQHHYILRERVSQVSGNKALTLKFRHPDRYIAQSRDMHAKKLTDVKVKFEEDIKAPFIQLYSYSTTGLVKRRTSCKDVKQMMQLFPGLSRSLDESTFTEKIIPVQKGTINELIIGDGSIQLGDAERAAAECALICWYDAAPKQEFPLIVEFSFRYGEDNERYNSKTATVAYDMFTLMQEKMAGWLGQSNETKTGLVYAGNESEIIPAKL